MTPISTPLDAEQFRQAVEDFGDFVEAMWCPADPRMFDLYEEGRLPILDELLTPEAQQELGATEETERTAEVRWTSDPQHGVVAIFTLIISL